MIILKNGGSDLTAALGAAHTSAAMSIAASARVVTPATPAYLPDAFYGASNGTTPVTLFSAPSSGTQVLVDFVSVLNTDTANKVVTVAVGSVVLCRVTLAPGERLEYTDANGWTTYSSVGGMKTTTADGVLPVSSQKQMVVLGADVVNDNATANTIADVTGLSFAVVNGNLYWFRFAINYTSAATATGSRWSINGPSASRLGYKTQHTTLNQTTSAATVEFFGAVSAYDTPTNASANSRTGAGANVAFIEGFIQPSANGSVIARFASEVSSSAITALAGSFVEYQQIS